MKIRVADHVCLQPCATGYRITAGRRSLLPDATSIDLIASCVAGSATADDVVRAISSESGEPAEKLHAAMRRLTSLGVFAPAGDEATPPRAQEFRTIAEGELPAEPLADLDAVLQWPRQTLLRPAPNGFYVWANPLHARVILTPATMRLLPSFAPPGQTIAKAVESIQDEGRRASTLKAIARLVKAGVLIPTRLDATVAPAPEPVPARAVPRKRELKFVRDASRGRIPVYCVYSIHQEQLHYPPLALGLMIAFAKHFRGGALLERFDFVEDWLDTEEATEEAHKRHGPGVFLFSSYIWSERPVLTISKQIRERDPDSVIIVGGPSAPKYEQAAEAYFKAHPQIDVIVRGEGEVTLSEILDKVTSPLREVITDGRLSGVNGLSFRPPQGPIVRTPERERTKDLSLLPSPYLTGVFDNLARDTEGGLRAVILETNRGCPYGCTFCDWGSATLQKIMKFPMDRVKEELDWIGRNKVPQIFCADANFGIFDRDVEVAELMVKTYETYGFPQQLTVNYAKNATERHAEILRILTRGGIHSEAVLSIQSTSEQTLKTIRRQNIKTERYDQLAGIFRKEGLSFASDLMIGLPGDTVESFKDSLQYFFERDVFVQAYQTVMLPNSPMADPEYIKENKIVLAGNVLVGSYSYTIEDLGVMTRLAGYYSLMVNLSVLKYVLHYLQNDRGLRALDVLHAMVKKFEHGDGPTRYPLMSWILGRYRAELERALADTILGDLDAPSSWEEFFVEVRDFLAQEFGVSSDPGLETAFAVQSAMLPRENVEYPLTVELKHDFVRYLGDRRAARGNDGPVRRLADYPAGQLVVSDPGSMSASTRPPRLGQDHISRFELESPLRPYTEGSRLSA